MMLQSYATSKFLQLSCDLLDKFNLVVCDCFLNDARMVSDFFPQTLVQFVIAKTFDVSANI